MNTHIKCKPSKLNINVVNSAISTLTNFTLGSQRTINTVKKYGALDSVRANNKVLTGYKQYPFTNMVIRSKKKTFSTNNQKHRKVKSLSLVNGLLTYSYF